MVQYVSCTTNTLYCVIQDTEQLIPTKVSYASEICTHYYLIRKILFYFDGIVSDVGYDLNLFSCNDLS